MLQKNINTPILGLRLMLKNKLKNDNISSTLLIGTQNTIRSGLYDFDNVKTSNPDDIEITELSDAIFNFNKGLNPNEPILTVKKICDKYLKMGIQTVILGFTEFAVMLDKEDMPKVNTIDVLVDATVRYILNNLMK